MCASCSSVCLEWKCIYRSINNLCYSDTDLGGHFGAMVWIRGDSSRNDRWHIAIRVHRDQGRVAVYNATKDLLGSSLGLGAGVITRSFVKFLVVWLLAGIRAGDMGIYYCEEDTDYKYEEDAEENASWQFETFDLGG